MFVFPVCTGCMHNYINPKVYLKVYAYLRMYARKCEWLSLCIIDYVYIVHIGRELKQKVVYNRASNKSKHLVSKNKLKPYSYSYDKCMLTNFLLIHHYIDIFQSRNRGLAVCVCACISSAVFFLCVALTGHRSSFLFSPSTRWWHTVYRLWNSAVLSGLPDATFPFNQYVSMWQLDTHLEHCTLLTRRLSSSFLETFLMKSKPEENKH